MTLIHRTLLDARGIIMLIVNRAFFKIEYEIDITLD